MSKCSLSRVLNGKVVNISDPKEFSTLACKLFIIYGLHNLIFAYHSGIYVVGHGQI